MSSEAATMPQETKQENVDNKIMADLGTVKEKMDLCDNMLHPGDGSPAPSLKNNEALLGVIGFLEACGPRMVELVEAATQGALSESVLMECLSVNDRLLKLLADIDTYAFTETPASTTAAAAPPKEDIADFSDLLLDDKVEPDVSSSVGDQKPSGLKSTEDDIFAEANDLLSAVEDDSNSKMPASTSQPSATTENDDFDDFFNERTKGM